MTKYGYRRSGERLLRYEVVAYINDSKSPMLVACVATRFGAKCCIRRRYRKDERWRFKERQPVTVVEHSEVINQG